MSGDPLELINRYRSRGVLPDTNILLLYFVGTFNRKLVSQFKRTAQFTEADFDLLRRLLAQFASVATTPNILTEVSNLSAQLGEPARRRYFALLAQSLKILGESYLPSAEAAADEAFTRLGLTDVVVTQLARDRYLVLTDDFDLADLLARRGIDVINFNHLRLLK